MDFDKNYKNRLLCLKPKGMPVGAFCKTPGNRLTALVEPFGANGGRSAERPYSDKASDSPHWASGFYCFCLIKPPPYSSFKSSSHAAADASDGMRQSPRGLSEQVPTFGPSGKQERLNCCAKKRR